MARRLIVAFALAVPVIAGAQGSPSVIASAQGSPSVIASAPSARSDLLRADQALAATVARVGLAQGLRTQGADDLVYLHPGAPVLSGREAVAGFLSTGALAGLVISWTPLHVEVSADGTLGVSYGATGFREGDRDLRFGRYLSAWRREGDRWVLAAHAQIAAFELPPPTAERPVLAALDRSPARPFIEADREFSAQAGRDGVAEAFGAWAADDAALIGASSPLEHGPTAIRAQMSGGPPGAHWAWGPVAAGASTDGTLGWTVGEATITGPGPDGKPMDRYSKYLTLWRLEQGSPRYLADGGSARPGPVSP